MSRKEDRILIAQDVIQWLRNGKLIAKHMTYVFWHSGAPTIKLDEELSIQLKDAKPCNVCAKGAAFICAVDRFNEIKAREVMDIDYEADDSLGIKGDRFEEFLHKFWDREQIDQIEAAFEGWSPGSQDYEQHNNELDEYQVMRLYNFDALPLHGASADVRLAMIMRNVIANDGEFNAKEFCNEMLSHGYDHSVLKMPPQSGE